MLFGNITDLGLWWFLSEPWWNFSITDYMVSCSEDWELLEMDFFSILAKHPRLEDLLGTLGDAPMKMYKWERIYKSGQDNLEIV